MIQVLRPEKTSTRQTLGRLENIATTGAGRTNWSFEKERENLSQREREENLSPRKREIGRTFKKWSFEWFTLEQPSSLDDACSLLNSLVRSLFPFFFFSLIRFFSLSSTKLHTYLSVCEPTDLQLPFIFVSCLASFPTLLPSLIHAMKSTSHKKRQRRGRRDITASDPMSQTTQKSNTWVQKEEIITPWERNDSSYLVRNRSEKVDEKSRRQFPVQSHKNTYTKSRKENESRERERKGKTCVTDCFLLSLRRSTLGQGLPLSLSTPSLSLP